MNIREVAEIRRHIRRDRSNMTKLYGCYVNANQEIISQFQQSTAMLSENEAEKYFNLLKRSLSGIIGKNLIDINFQTSQVADSKEHKFLMALRQSQLSEDSLRTEFFKKVIDTVKLKENYLILIGFDSYDVPFKGKDGNTDMAQSDETYQFLLCAICPVKQTQPKLHYQADEKQFRDGGITNAVCMPELGFLFPAFDERSTNIYNALYYTRSPKQSYEAFVDVLFHTPIPKPAYEQKKSFEALLEHSLKNECSLDVVQSVHEQMCQRIELHKESRTPETLLVSKNEVTQLLASSGISEAHVAKFSVDYDEAFGFDAELYPKNVIDNRHFEIKTPAVTIQVAPEHADLVEMRVINGVKYILICAEDEVEVNGVHVNITEKETANI